MTFWHYDYEVGRFVPLRLDWGTTTGRVLILAVVDYLVAALERRIAQRMK